MIDKTSTALNYKIELPKKEKPVDNTKTALSMQANLLKILEGRSPVNPSVQAPIPSTTDGFGRTR